MTLYGVIGAERVNLAAPCATCGALPGGGKRFLLSPPNSMLVNRVLDNISSPVNDYSINANLVMTFTVIISESNTKTSNSDDHLLQTIEDLSRQVYCLPAQNETMGFKQNVATEIKCNHALLMKRVYDQFLHTVQTRCKACDITNQMNLPSIHWVLAQIVIK